MGAVLGICTAHPSPEFLLHATADEDGLLLSQARFEELSPLLHHIATNYPPQQRTQRRAMFIPATSIVRLDLGDDFYSLSRFAEDVANVVHVLRSADEGRKDDIDLCPQPHSTHPSTWRHFEGNTW